MECLSNNKMAADESLLEIDDENILNGIIKLQGQIRGMLIRNALRDIQRDYEDIVSDIEEDMTVHWPSHTLGRPTLKRKKDNHQNRTPGENQDGCLRNKEKAQHLTRPAKLGNMRVSRNPHFIRGNTSDSDMVDGMCSDCNSEIAVATEMQGALKSDNAPQTSPRAEQALTTESQSCEMEGQTSSIVSFAEERITNACISKEVQTEFVNETDISERSIDLCANFTAIPDGHQTTLVTNTSPVPKVPDIPNKANEETETLSNVRGASVFHYLPDKEEADSLASVSSSSSIKTIPELHTQELEFDQNDVTAINGTGTKSMIVLSVDDLANQQKDTNVKAILDDLQLKPEPSSGEGNESSGDLKRTVDQPADKDLRQSSCDLPADKDQLLKLKGTVAMELLWVEQAIVSRKNYLRLKQQLA